MSTASPPAPDTPDDPGRGDATTDAGGAWFPPSSGSDCALTAPSCSLSYSLLLYATWLLGFANPSAPYMLATPAALRSDGTDASGSRYGHVGMPSSALHIMSPALLNAWPRPIACINSCAAVAATSGPEIGPHEPAVHTTVWTGAGRGGSLYILAQPKYSSRHPTSSSWLTRLTTTSGRSLKNRSPGLTTSNSTSQSPPYRCSMDELHVSMPSWTGTMYGNESSSRSGLGAIATSGGPSMSIE